MAQAIHPESFSLALENNIERSTKFSSTVWIDQLTPPADIEDQYQFDKHIGDALPVTAEEARLIAVIGVGYVGLHLVELFAPKYNVIAYDVSTKRLESLQATLAHYATVIGTTDTQLLKKATHFLIAVPTAVRADSTIDLTHIKAAIQTVFDHARPGAVIVIESSVAVGMTRELLAPLIKQKFLKAGMSPERVDPGRTEPPVAQIPKIISGLDDISPGSLDAISEIYSNVFNRVVPVSKPEVAEMMKLFENCQRMMCIAYVNEMADACVDHGISPYEVCKAAATKPFGYIPFTPGLGVGGPCIPCNPFYLLTNNSFPLLRAATEKMWQRPVIVAKRLMDRLNKRLVHPRVLVVGIAFKPGQSLTTNAPGLILIQALQEMEGVKVQFADPLVEQDVVPYVSKLNEKTQWTSEHIESNFDAVVIAMKQTGLDLDIIKNSRVIVETFVQDE